MSGYLRFQGTGFKPFDDVISAIETAGDCYHHTSQWQDEGDNGKTLIDGIDEKIVIAAAEIATLTAELARVRAERDSALKDAERYRWLRQTEGVEFRDGNGFWCGQSARLDELDAAIDAAREG